MQTRSATTATINTCINIDGSSFSESSSVEVETPAVEVEISAVEVTPLSPAEPLVLRAVENVEDPMNVFNVLTAEIALVEVPVLTLN